MSPSARFRSELAELAKVEVSAKVSQNYTRPDERLRCANCKFIDTNRQIPKCTNGWFAVSMWGFCDFYQQRK